MLLSGKMQTNYYCETDFVGFRDIISEHNGANSTANSVFGLLQKLLINEPSDILIKHLFSLLRIFVINYEHVLFNNANEFCQTLCLEV